MRPTTEFSIELTAQELVHLPDDATLVAIDDLCRVENLRTHDEPVNTAPEVTEEVEIELGADEIDALLEGRHVVRG